MGSSRDALVVRAGDAAQPMKEQPLEEVRDVARGGTLGEPDPRPVSPPWEWPPPDELDAHEVIEVRRSTASSSVLPHRALDRPLTATVPVRPWRGPDSPSRPADLVWPPPTADLDAVEVVTLDGGAFDRRDRAKFAAAQPAPQSFRRPLLAAAGLIATAAVAWPGVWFQPRSAPPRTIANMSQAPVGTAPAPPAASRPVLQVPVETARPQARSTGIPPVVAAAARPPVLATTTSAPARRAATAGAVVVAVRPEQPQRAALTGPPPSQVAPARTPASAPLTPESTVPAQRLTGPPVLATVGSEPARLETPASPQPAPHSVSARAELTDTRDLAGGAPPSPLPQADGARIHAVLRQYASAYRRLDAAAAAAVWPSLDTRALARAFDGLQSQQLVFDRCELAISGAKAQAACQGSATYVPRVGNRSPRTDARQWSFELERVDGERWRIRTASMR